MRQGVRSPEAGVQRDWGPNAAPLAAGFIVRVFRSITRTIRTIIGVPDYERYLEHTQRCHPERTPLTRDEFARDRLEARYSQPGNRCC